MFTIRIAFAALVLLVPAAAQQAARPATPPPPARKDPLSLEPRVYDTFDEKIRVSVVVHGIGRPWSLLPLPDGNFLVSARSTGQVFAIRDGVLDPTPLTGLPATHNTFRTGMLDMVLHPKYAENKWIYFTYTKPLEGTTFTLALARAHYSGKGFTDVQELYAGNPALTWGSRMAFGLDGLLYITVGGAARSKDAVATNTIFGKVIRLKDDGTAPADNPFVGQPGARPEIYTVGHPTNGYGRDNDGSPMPPLTDGMEQAWITWNPGITPSGLLFYTGDRFPKWKGNLFTGSIQRGKTSGTGGLERITFNDKLWEQKRESLLLDMHQRVRDVRQGADGLIYLLTEEEDGAVLKIEPAK
jgi:glucose/arabinose dehydrogenase